MRKTLLASAAVFGMAVALPGLATPQALAQDNSATPPAATTDTQGTGHMPPPGQTGANEPNATQPITQGEANGNTPSTMARPAATAAGNESGREPMARHASNIGTADTRGEVAPRLPEPDLGPNAGPVQYLQAAQNALQRRHSGMAQEAMERAETRLLDRATAPSAANQPDNAPAVQEITAALEALGRRDWQGADQHLNAALQHAQMAENEQGGGMMRQGGMMPQGQTQATSPLSGTGTAMPPNTAGAPAQGMSQGSGPVSYDSHYPPQSGIAAPQPGAPMTAGQHATPMGGVMPPNGGVMRPNGGVDAPNP